MKHAGKIVVVIVVIVLIASLSIVFLQRPAPVGELRQGKIPAEYAYFMLPDTYVITDTDLVNGVLSEVYSSTWGTTWPRGIVGGHPPDGEVGFSEQNVMPGDISTFSSPPSDNIGEFEEFDEISIYVDASGNASCQWTAQLLPSKLADLMKTLAQLIGIDKMKLMYIEEIRGSFAKYGLEVRNPSCEISSGENFEIIMGWETPAIAWWGDNRWTITFDWVDNQSAAKDVISGEEYAWMLARNVAVTNNLRYAYYRISSKTTLILPENAGDVYCPLLDSSRTIDHGGGTYSRTSIYSDQIGGRFAIVENELRVTATENEITLTPQQLIENSLFWTVHYNGVSPENVSLESSVEQVRLDLKYGRELREQYLVYSAGTWHSLTPAQVLYYAAEAIENYNRGGQFSIQQPTPVTAPDNENGDLKACWENLSKNEYVNIAQTIRETVGSTGAAPGTIDTALGKIRFRDALYTFTRILSAYKESGELPSTLTFVPVPTGELTWEYNTAKISKDFAEGLCNWTGSNLSYGLSFSPPTSEEVLVSKKGQCRDYTNVYLALARTVEMPARRVSGWITTTWQAPTGWEFIVGTTPDGKTVAAHAWAQVYLPDEGWIPLEPQSKEPQLYIGTLPYEVYRQLEQTWTRALAGYETARGVL